MSGMEPTTGRRAVIYARISVAQEASVSVARQMQAAEQYAAARGWQVVATFTDEGVSATRNKPEDRAGWRALLDSTETYDAVIIWKIDRLARRVIDFHLANEALRQRGAGLVAVENAIDMTTSDGRMMAGLMATFAEYEAEEISARVAAARTHLLKAGRSAGGEPPYGWRTVPNPDGPGYVVVQDPDRIDVVRAMADRTLAGATIYSTVRWLNEQGHRTHTGKGPWTYTVVERLLRNPVLAGMTLFNPGHVEKTRKDPAPGASTRAKTRGPEVLRDEHGLPVVDESVAVMPVAEWRAMVAALDARSSPQTMKRAERAKTSPLLSGLVWCGRHEQPQRMHRANNNGRHGYACPKCRQSIVNFEELVIERFLWAKGDHVRWTPVRDVYTGGAADLPEIEHRLDELDAAIRTAPDRAARNAHQEQKDQLLDLRDEKRQEAAGVTQRWEPTQHFAADWAAAATVEDRRAVLDDALNRITVLPGTPGRRTRETMLARLQFDWKDPDRVGPVEAPDDDTLASN